MHLYDRIVLSNIDIIAEVVKAYNALNEETRNLISLIFDKESFKIVAGDLLVVNFAGKDLPLVDVSRCDKTIIDALSLLFNFDKQYGVYDLLFGHDTMAVCIQDYITLNNLLAGCARRYNRDESFERYNNWVNFINISKPDGLNLEITVYPRYRMKTVRVGNDEIANSYLVLSKRLMLTPEAESIVGISYIRNNAILPIEDSLQILGAISTIRKFKSSVGNNRDSVQ